MTGFSKTRIFKYIVYFLGLPCIIFLPVFLFKHSGFFIGMISGLAAHLLFSVWLFDFKWPVSISFGLFILLVAFFLIRLVDKLIPQIGNFNAHTEKYYEWITILASVLITLLLCEAVYLLGRTYKGNKEPISK